MRTRALPRAATAALVAALAAILAVPASGARDDLDLISRAAGPAGAGADGDSFLASLSADGRFVAFTSGGTNLVTEDVKTVDDIFLRDTLTGSVTLVSRADGPTGAGATADSNSASVSADGRLVAFSSSAQILPADTNAAEDIYLRDTVAGTTRLVSRAFGADGAVGDGSSVVPWISPDGRRIVFQSGATNFSGDDADLTTDIFVRDTVTNTTELVSRASTALGAAGDANSYAPARITADGRYIAFESEADNLSTEDDKAVRDVFVRDLVDRTTTLVSRATGLAGVVGDDLSSDASISADGRHVAFRSRADSLSAVDDKAVADVFVRDLVTRTTTLASRATGVAGAVGNGESELPVLSADGRSVAFESDADSLSSEDNDTARNIFVRDLLAGTTTLASRAAGPTGAGADGTSFDTAISADGRFVAFESAADNLSGEDANAFYNIFRRDLSALPAPAGPAGPGTTRVGGAAASATARCAGVRATIVGTSKRNVIRGTARRDVIAALGGNDLVRGLGGDDLICLGAGNDRGIGGAGADRILGQAGADRAEGGLGRDLLEGGLGADVLLGGAGADRLLGLAGRDRAVGGAGGDVCKVELRTAC